MSILKFGEGTVVVAGAITQKPGFPGHAWVFLHYLLGFRRLGFDVVFVDQLGRDPTPSELAWIRDVMTRAGLDGSWSLLLNEGSIGLSRGEVIARTQTSLFLLNVMGFLKNRDILDAARRRVFLDIDPGFGQMWRELGLADVFAGHDCFVTIAENMGKPGCLIPTCGLHWLTTRQPVVLSEWPQQTGNGSRFTSVARWRSDNAPVMYKEHAYGLRVHEFRKFLSLPKLVDESLELALEIDPAETRDLDLLSTNGWRLTNPRGDVSQMAGYRSYLQSSRGEFLVAKNMYVDTRSGWFSDRSACYLASGRPVIAQDTSLHGLYPLGEGLLAYETLDDAVAAVHAIGEDYPRHSRRAREIAEEYFDSDKVLVRLIEGITH